ncbi:hypothetical protein NMY22_g12164 [Coprinellus aureogranulatus]|nr:hypothetical protein NMY22_g12164 [Coprinellus aureogranulatus]
MREVDDQAATLQPFPLPRGDELVDDGLGGVHEITTLSFPDGESVGQNEGVTEVETESTEFGERRVADNEASLRLLRWERVPHSMSWPDTRTWTSARVSEANARASVNTLAVLDHLATSTEDTSGVSVGVFKISSCEPVGHVGETLLPLGTLVGGELAKEADGLDVVAVQMEDECVDGLGNVGGVGCEREKRGTVGGEVVEAHGLVDGTLAGKGGVTMKETHGSVVLLLVILKVLDGVGLAKDDGSFSFEMGRVGGKTNRKRRPREKIKSGLAHGCSGSPSGAAPLTGGTSKSNCLSGARTVAPSPNPESLSTSTAQSALAIPIDDATDRAAPAGANTQEDEHAPKDPISDRGVTQEGENTKESTKSTTRRSRKLNIATVKFHALGHYPGTIRSFGPTDLYSTELGESFHRSPKAWYKSTSKRYLRKELSRHERRRARLQRLKEHILSQGEAFEDNSKGETSKGETSNAEWSQGGSAKGDTAKERAAKRRRLKAQSLKAQRIAARNPDLHHYIGISTNSPVCLWEFSGKTMFSADIACSSFVRNLKQHFFRRFLLATYPDFNGESLEEVAQELDWSNLVLKDDRLYTHRIMRIKYTTYDARRDEDIIHLETDQSNIMMLNREHSYGHPSHPYTYGKVIAIIHTDVGFVGDIGRQGSSYTFRSMEVLWVRKYRMLPSSGPEGLALDEAELVAIDEPGSHTLIDPVEVVRACHIVPDFTRGPRYPDGKGKSIIAGDGKDYQSYFINRFSDRDMFMRYEWGLAVGHAYTHREATEVNEKVLATRAQQGVPEIHVQPATLMAIESEAHVPSQPTPLLTTGCEATLATLREGQTGDPEAEGSSARREQIIEPESKDYEDGHDLVVDDEEDESDNYIIDDEDEDDEEDEDYDEEEERRIDLFGH